MDYYNSVWREQTKIWIVGICIDTETRFDIEYQNYNVRSIYSANTEMRAYRLSEKFVSCGYVDVSVGRWQTDACRSVTAFPTNYRICCEP
jgi:hypothetical protein